VHGKDRTRKIGGLRKVTTSAKKHSTVNNEEKKGGMRSKDERQRDHEGEPGARVRKVGTKK